MEVALAAIQILVITLVSLASVGLLIVGLSGVALYARARKWPPRHEWKYFLVTLCGGSCGIWWISTGGFLFR
jgi:hypothetical protein